MTNPMYVGNYEYEADERELKRLFSKYGRLDHVEFKSGFCFVYYEDMRDAKEAIRDLDGREWGRRHRRLRVELARNDVSVRAKEEKRREVAQPNTTLFVAGFEPRVIRERDLERVFEKFGRLKRCQIKKSFGFIEYCNLDDAIDAQKELDRSKALGREMTVEFCVKDFAPARTRSPSRRSDEGRRYRSRSRSGDRRPSRRSPSYSPPRSPASRRHRRSRSPPRSRRDDMETDRYTRSRSRSMSPFERRTDKVEEPSRSRSQSPRVRDLSP